MSGSAAYASQSTPLATAVFVRRRRHERGARRGAALGALEEARLAAQVLSHDGVWLFVGRATHQRRIDVVNVENRGHAARVGIQCRVEVIEIEKIRTVDGDLHRHRVTDRRAIVTAEEHIRFSRQRRAEYSKRFDRRAPWSHPHRADANSGGRQRRHERFLPRLDWRDEAHVEVGGQPSQQVKAAQVSAAIERPRQFARDRQDRRTRG